MDLQSAIIGGGTAIAAVITAYSLLRQRSAASAQKQIDAALNAYREIVAIHQQTAAREMKLRMQLESTVETLKAELHAARQSKENPVD